MKMKLKYLILGIVYLLFLLAFKFILLYPHPNYALNNGISIVPFRTIMDFTLNYQMFNSDIIVKWILSFFFLVPWILIVFHKNPSFKDRDYIIIIVSLSFLYSIFNRIFEIGFFDIDTIILRIIITLFVFYLMKNLKIRRKNNEKI